MTLHLERLTPLRTTVTPQLKALGRKRPSPFVVLNDLKNFW
jgi:hypothetical protein